MITISIILSVILLTVAWALFVPFRVEINTDHQYYRIMLPGLLGVRALKKNEKWLIKGHVFFVRFNLLKKGGPRKGENEKRPVQKKRKPRKITNTRLFMEEAFYALGKIIRSFNVKRFKLEVDTGDFTLNARLYPLVAVSGGNYNNININFENRNGIDLKATGQVFFIAWYTLQFYLKNKYLIIKK